MSPLDAPSGEKEESSNRPVKPQSVELQRCRVYW